MIRVSDYFHPNLYPGYYSDNYSEFDNDTNTTANFSEDYIYVEEKDTFWKCLQYLLEKTFCCVTK